MIDVEQGAGGRAASTPPRRSSSIATRRPPLLGAARRRRSARASIPSGLVTYIIDRNVNYTNVCVAKCNFCAFYREVGSPEGYVLGFDELFRKIDETIAVGGVQLLLQGGHNPDLPLTWYEDLFRAVKERYPDVQAARAVAARGDPSVAPVAAAGAGGDRPPDRRRPRQHSRRRRRDPGRSRPQAAALLRQGVGRRVARRDAPRAPRRPAHHGDDDVRHGRDRRGAASSTCCGCASCRTKPAVSPRSSPGAISRITPSSSGTEATGVDYLRTLALARIVLDNFDNLQASWVTQGGKVGQLSLAYGANDMGSVMIEENVVRAAGASYCMDELEIVRNIEDAGLRRQAPQHALRDARRSDFPRAGRAADARARHRARADGDTSVPEELRQLSGPEPRRQTAPRRPELIRYHAAWVAADRRAADSRRLGRVDRGRIVALGQARAAADADAATSISARWRSCPGWSTRIPTWSCRICAAKCRPRQPFVSWIRGVMAARRAASRPERAGDLDAHRQGIAESMPAARRSWVTSATPWPLSRRWRRVRWPASCSTRSSASMRPIRGRSSSRRVRGSRAASQPVASAPSLAAHAPYSVAPLVFRAIREAVDARSVRALQRAPGRVGRGGRVHRRPAAGRGARCSRNWARGIRPGRRPA